MKTKTLLLVCVLFLVVLSGCSSIDKVVGAATAESTVQNFLNEMNTAKPETALDYVCESIALPRLQENTFQDISVSLISPDIDEDKATAQVNVKAELKWVDPDGMAAKKELDIVLDLNKSSGEWCITRSSLINSLFSVLDISY